MGKMITIRNKKTKQESEVSEETLKQLQSNELLKGSFVVVGEKVPAEVKKLQSEKPTPNGGNGMASEAIKEKTETK